MENIIEEDEWKKNMLKSKMLWIKSREEIDKLISELPQDLKNLNLSYNWLWEKTWEELKEVLSKLPRGLKKLDLRNNYLWEKENKIKQYCEIRWIEVIF